MDTKGLLKVDRNPQRQYGADWRTNLPPHGGQKVANWTEGSFHRLLPCSGPEQLQRIKNLANIFEEKSYTAATSPIDYAKILAVKMVHVENIVANFLPPSNSASNNRSPPKAGTA
ncbi:mediator of RNA polymerase II transcription subunit 15a-like isoform X1 [Diospyros lotus]|uniref:mediator of RNA polymerase II transcription subunit 15a-like isoform X1 n=1 Tax=Diospyros lotus TaxID=55363 RepID=UPI0022525A5C|nr:mediator of RNA polymerase II transcription subunit 15a-like isoform X1 [Diospyros lotus]